MAWSRLFRGAEITAVANSFKLEINWSWYGLINYTETYVYATEKECETKLLEERCNGLIRRGETEVKTADCK